MIDRIENTIDLECVIEAYYNFKGHKTMFSCTTMDRLLKRALKIGHPEMIFDILNNHHYLMYYPHTCVMNEILMNLMCNEKSDCLKRFLVIVSDRKLIQVDQQFLQILKNEGKKLDSDAV